MSGFNNLRELSLRQIWDGIHARVISGERLSLGVVELDPGAVARQHSHEHEQLGIVLSGTITFRIGDETRELGPGDTWTIPSNVVHEATLVSDRVGCIVLRPVLDLAVACIKE